MSSHVPRIAYFGLPLGALALTHAGHAPHVVVLGHRGATGARRLHRLLAARAPVFIQPDLHAPALREAIRDARVDVIISWFYPKQIPEALLAEAPRGAFGAHPSLLPRWRGPDPYFWAIFAGDAETGVSLHRLEREYDTGAVIAQRRLAIAPDETAWQLAKRLDRPGLALIVECAQRLAAGEVLAGTPQDAAGATYAPAPSEAQLALDWRRPAAEIVRLVRAAAPYPGASAQLGEQLVEVLAAEVHAGSLPRALEPADAVWTPQGLVVRAGDAGVRVGRVRTEDDTTLSGAALCALFSEGLARVGFEVGAPPVSSGRTEA